MDKIVCAGKNYLEHAKELGDAVPEKPVLFLKPPSVLREVKQGGVATLSFPVGTSELHHECEIVIEIGSDIDSSMGTSLPSGTIEGLSVGLDMTKRDLQGKLKKAGHPWTIAKVFPDSAVVGPRLLAKDFSQWRNTEFSLTVNGEVRQKGLATQMILSVEACLAHAASFFPLRRGDLLFTGTPAGVGPVKVGDKLELVWGAIAYTVVYK